MVPLQAGGSRVGQAAQRIRNWSFSFGFAVALIVGGVLGQSSLATAQPVSPAMDPGYFPATGFRISSPAILDYFRHRSGSRTIGYPISNEFPLLGRRVQLFQRQMLELASDGTVTPANILDPDVLPVTRIDGLSLPSADPDLLGSAPTPAMPDYSTQALAFVNLVVPDEWNGLPVNFQSTYLNAVTCAEAFGPDPCDQSQLSDFALELWGLPTSLPTHDPVNPDFVYQRFQRGIMHFSRATGATQALVLGEWLKRIIIGVDLSPDLGREIRRSRFFAQYAPTRPLAVDRPADLPDTSLVQAFRSAETLSAAGQLLTAEPTLPTNVAQTATSVAMTATSISATQVALTGQGTSLTATALSLTTPTSTPGGIVSSVPVDPSGCMGDEQMWFVPRKPNMGVHVQISVTSRRHHDARSMVLTGPLDAGSVVERVGPLGFVWTWTVVPAVQAFHEWSFYADGLRPCITSGFNTFAPLGATATPTNTPPATNTPGATATLTPTGTATPPARPIASALNPNAGGCNQLVRLTGSGFGSSQSQFGGSLAFAGPGGTRNPAVLSWTDREIDFTTPSGLSIGSQYQVFVSLSSGGTSDSLVYTVTGPATPTPPPAGTVTPTPVACS